MKQYPAKKRRVATPVRPGKLRHTTLFSHSWPAPREGLDAAKRNRRVTLLTAIPELASVHIVSDVTSAAARRHVAGPGRRCTVTVGAH